MLRTPIRRAGLPLLALAAVALPAAVPALADAATTAPYELRASLPRADARMRELLVTARCASGCTLTLRNLALYSYEGTDQVNPVPPQTLRGSRRVAPGKTVVLRVPVAPALSAAALSALDAGQAVGSTVGIEVVTNGETYTVGSQLIARTAGTPSPFPSVRSTVVRLPKVRPGELIPYLVTIRGTQTSTWSYDRGEVNGACTTIANGRGVQRLKFRTVRPYEIVQGLWAPGDPSISAGKVHGYGIPHVPVRVDAVRDSVANAGVAGGGDCGGTSGGEGRPQPACVRTGSKLFHFQPILIDRGTLYVSTTFGRSGQDTPDQKPDCPVEVSDQVVHPLQVLEQAYEGDGHRDSDLTKGMTPGRGDAPGLVIEVFRKKRTERIPGGTLTTSTTFTMTFRRTR